MKRISDFCFGIGIVFYAFECYVLYRVLKSFPSLHGYSESIFAIAWMPLGGAAIWVKNKIEDWLCADIEEK